MDHSCVLCFEDMDMKLWNDERESTPTCYKLECGHAYHTKCIIECLKKSNLGCPNCNERRTPQEELTRKGLLIKTVAEIRKNPELRPLKDECNQAVKEIVETRKQIQKEAKEFIQKRKQELLFDEKRTYYIKCMNAYKKQAIKVAEKISLVHLGSTRITRSRYGYNEFETLIFNGLSPYRMWRIKRPSIYVSG